VGVVGVVGVRGCVRGGASPGSTLDIGSVAGAAWVPCATGEVVGDAVGAKAPLIPLSASVSSLGTIHSLLDGPSAIRGSIWRYW
jgi:hypothetical protein